jgi:hypothetical protein
LGQSNRSRTRRSAASLSWSPLNDKESLSPQLPVC